MKTANFTDSISAEGDDDVVTVEVLKMRHHYE